ncbi:MAG: ABC transporter permease [Vicinamibacterales bacterium]|nr:ABC transporter permease [Vicinamibacterales bacterium]HJN43162.1 FtsX-like permease family protein [Vicinamibacterales bacterium]
MLAARRRGGELRLDGAVRCFLGGTVGGADGAERRSALYTIVGRDYFRSLGLSMLRGREFTAAEAMADTPPAVAIVDETLAQALWPNSDPLGQQIRFREGATGQLSDLLLVVGLAPGRRNEIFDQQPTPHVYVPFGWQYRGNMNIHVRLAAGGRGAAQSMLQTVRREVRAFDERLPVLSLKTLEDFRADSPSIWAVQAGASVFTTFGALALFLAVIGLYGVKAYVVSRRTREIGIRMALGAGRGDVLWLVLREGLVLALAGLCVGLLLSIGTARLLDSLLYEVSTFDPVVFILSPLLHAGSALLASYLPARRATRVLPMVALRHE